MVRVGTKRSHTYHLLAYGRGPRKLFEPFLITMNDKSEAFPSFQHEGAEFIYMLERLPIGTAAIRTGSSLATR